MEMMTARRYPIGIQTFSEIIREGYVYVDKTDLVWQLAHYAKYIFMSRPRRFGKSLLTSTLESYFSGEKDLFEGLKIMQLEQEWTQYLVIRLDLSMAKAQASAEALQKRLLLMLEDYADIYGRKETEQHQEDYYKALFVVPMSRLGSRWLLLLTSMMRRCLTCCIKRLC